jgi:molybdenum transport protein
MNDPAPLRTAPTASKVPPYWPAPTAGSRAELEALLADDVPHGDLTTEALGIGAVLGIMRFTARDAMVLAFAEDTMSGFASLRGSC